METKPDMMPQYIYDWAKKNIVNLKLLFNDFCIETDNQDKTGFPEFCHFMYFECKH